MRWKLGAPIILAWVTTSCGPSIGQTYEQTFAAGQRAYHAGRYEEAAQQFERAAGNATRVKDRDEALFLAARMHEKRGAPDAAKAVLERLSKESPDGPRAGRAEYEKAMLEIEHGDVEKGYVMLLDATFKFPKHGSARRSLKRIIEHEQDKGGDEAVLAWIDGPGKVLRGSDLDQELDYEKALAMDRLGRTADARDLLLKTAEKHPYPFGGLTDDALWHASLMEEKLGRYEAAIAHLRTLLAVRESSMMTGSYERPRYSPSQLRIAELYRDKLHDHRAARREFHRVYTAHPTSILRDDALWSEARLAHEDGDASEACSLVKRLRDEFADSRYARCAHLLCASITPAANARACADYVERQVVGEGDEKAADAEPAKPDASSR